MPDDGAIARMYDAEYFESDYHCGHTGGICTEGEFAEGHRRLLETLRAHKPSGRFLEVGAAAGGFLDQAKAAGYNVSGVELSAAACAAAVGRGVELHCGTLESAGFQDSSFDIVYMGDVLEHMPRPHDALVEAARVTAPGGLVALQCPTNIGLLSSRVGMFIYGLLGRSRRSPIPPYHLYEFTPGTLKALVRAAGYDIVVAKADILTPWSISLRGGATERTGKLLLHWPNYLITKLTGLMGDRVMVIGRKRG
jgi:SAM-dependent methyltransferase